LTVRVTGKRIGGLIKTALSQAREQVKNSPDTFEILTTDQLAKRLAVPASWVRTKEKAQPSRWA